MSVQNLGNTKKPLVNYLQACQWGVCSDISDKGTAVSVNERNKSVHDTIKDKGTAAVIPLNYLPVRGMHQDGRQRSRRWGLQYLAVAASLRSYSTGTMQAVPSWAIWTSQAVVRGVPLSATAALPPAMQYAWSRSCADVLHWRNWGCHPLQVSRVSTSFPSSAILSVS